MRSITTEPNIFLDTAPAELEAVVLEAVAANFKRAQVFVEYSEKFKSWQFTIFTKYKKQNARVDYYVPLGGLPSLDEAKAALLQHYNDYVEWWCKGGRD